MKAIAWIALALLLVIGLIAYKSDPTPHPSNTSCEQDYAKCQQDAKDVADLLDK